MLGPDGRGAFLGVDGGRSGTRALLIDETGSVLGYGDGGDANHQGQGYESAVRNVVEGVRDACRAAGIVTSDIVSGYFALAGDDVPNDHARLESGLSALLPGLHFGLSNDVWAGLRAGSVDGSGIAVNCGSGCGAVGRAVRGEKAIIPDLGYVFGDSGGGHQIAIDAVRAVIRAWDGRGERTMLTGMILDMLEQPSVAAVYEQMYRHDLSRERLDAATPLVFKAAASGDAVATAILRHIGDELGLSASAIARRLLICDDHFTFVLTGGAFRTLCSPLSEAAIARLRTTAPRCRPTLPALLPVAGAALLALDASGVGVTDVHYARLRAAGYGWPD